MEATACYRHPNKQARIVCQRCDRPICPDCMVQSAVGFHCPECVQQAPQRRLKVRRVQPMAVTSFVIITINVVVWLAILATGMGASPVVDLLALTPHGFCPASDTQILLTDAAGCANAGLTWHAGVATGAFWQVLTSAFTHVQPWHIIFNMMALFVLGPQLEAFFGRARFLAIYGFSALTASAAVVVFSTPFLGTLGASGAIFGLMGAFLVLAIKRKVDLRSIAIWLGINALLTFLVPNVSWEGHVGGLVGGITITAALIYLPSRQRSWQWVLVGLLLLAVVAVIAATCMLRFSE